MAVRIVTPSPFHALFAGTMFIAPEEARARRASRRNASCCTRPASRPTRPRTAPAPAPSSRSHPAEGQVLIGGTFYTGEIKKSIFTAMNDRLPLDGVFPMHCSANVGDDGRRRDLLRALRHRQDDALGRSQAAADRRRRARLGRLRRVQLRGRLLREDDPPLGGGRARDLRDDPRRSGRCSRTSSSTRTAVLDLDSDAKTENTRAAYSLEAISNARAVEARRVTRRTSSS